MGEETGPVTLLTEIETEQSRLRGLLSGRDEAFMAERPPNGTWSVLENVRHLLFAEQSHLGRFRAGGREWSPLGLPPTGMQGQRQLQVMAGTPTASVAEVMDAWVVAHASIRAGIEGDAGGAAKVLDRHLRHLRAHIKVIERLLRNAGSG
ncbi:MAG: DinB family protein [Dehalococcoidia bacterium]|nr:DinB family protein [Dehalococcoidia bacterium]MCB9486536.1 DinB family protein [Thermoflexaceae bacterium]